MKHPIRSIDKAGVPNFDPIFSSAIPGFLYDQNPFSSMRTKPGSNHLWTYAAISTIITNYVQCPIRMYKVADPKKLYEDHPVLKLLRRPNPSMSGTNFLESICWKLALPTRRTPGGTAFIWGSDGRGGNANFRRGDIPDELWIDSDQGARANMNKQRILLGFHFDMHESAPYDYGVMDLANDELIRVNHFNPYDANLGLSPGHPLRVAVGQDAAAAEFNTNFMGNNGAMTGLFSPKMPLTPQQQNEMRKNFDTYFGGAKNAGKIGVAPFDVKFEQLNMTASDMQYMEQLGWNRESVLAAYKVSKFAVNLYEDLNYATAKVAKQQLFDTAIMPINALIMEELNESWIEHIDGGQWRICVDFSGVAALRDDTSERVKRAEILVMMGVPPMIALQMCDVPTDLLDEDTMPWLLQNQGPNAPFQGDAAGNEPDKPGAGKPPKTPKKGVLNKQMTREEKDAVNAEYVEQVLNPGEASCLKDVRRYMVVQRNRVLDTLDSWEASGRSVKNTPATMFIPDKEQENMLLRGMMYRHYVAQSKRAHADINGKITAVRKKDVLGMEATTEATAKWIEQRLLFISEINGTTFDGLEKQVAEILSRSLTEELTTEQTAKALREGIQEVYTGRVNNSKTIARTEMGAVSCFVTNEAMVQAKVTRKAWLASKDEQGFDANVRHTHRLADEQGPIPMDQEFNNGLMYPMENGAPAKEVINCRCNQIPIQPEGEEDAFA